MSGERLELVKGTGRAVLLTIATLVSIFGVIFGVLWCVGRFLALERTVEELAGFRVGIPATMLPSDRQPYDKIPATYRGRKATFWLYKSSASGTAANADYLVIVNDEGIVEAAFSRDIEAGREWAGKHLDQ